MLMSENAKLESRATSPQRLSEEQGSALISTFDVRILSKLMIVLATGIFIYGFRLGASPLDRTEPFRALVAHQMVLGGDWLIPRLYGEVYLRKPPLIYWIEAGTEMALRHANPFVWRLPSAMGSAILALFVAWFSGRWFGPRALLPAGFACLALVALWDQNRGADIDALNTAFAVATSLCVLELICGSARQRGTWTLAMGLSLGATLLLKGPGGLPQIVGAILGPAIVLRNWKNVRRPSILVGFLIGIGIFSVYIIAAKLAMHRAGIVPDKTGWYEVVEKVFLHGWKRRAVALLMPVELLAFALPVSIVLPFAIVLVRQTDRQDTRRVRVMALLGTLSASVVIWMIDGNDNPRYEYVMLPLLAPVAGFVWSGWDRRSSAFSSALSGVAVLICGACAGIALKLPNADWKHGVVGIAVALSGGALVFLLLFGLSSKALFARAAGPVLVGLLVLLAIPMAERKNAERRRKSSATAATQLRGIIGTASRVSAAGVVRDLPELFYYAGVDVDSYGEFGLPKLCAARGGHWVVISENERYPAYSTIRKYIPAAFPRGITQLHMPDPRDRIYAGWYDPPAGANVNIEQGQSPAPPADFGNDE
jgi:4-amino-4-deoxy-L-arabinose transferase-like glycosyltransferase